MIFGFPLFEYIVLLLPSLLLMSLSILPQGVGLILAIVSLRARRPSSYVMHLLASSAAGIVGVYFLRDLVFGSALRSSSTAGLAFIFIPFFTLGGLLVGYVMAIPVKLTLNLSILKDQHIPSVLKKLLVLPAGIFMILFLGILNKTISSNDLNVSERAMSSGALHYELAKSKRPGADRFGITLFLAQNVNAPDEILQELSKSPYPQIRAQVANNPRTSISIIQSLQKDSDKDVRDIAEKRLEAKYSGLDSSAAEALGKEWMKAIESKNSGAVKALAEDSGAIRIFKNSIWGKSVFFSAIDSSPEVLELLLQKIDIPEELVKHSLLRLSSGGSCKAFERLVRYAGQKKMSLDDSVGIVCSPR